MRKLPRIIVKFKNYLSTSVFVLRLKRMVSFLNKFFLVANIKKFIVGFKKNVFVWKSSILLLQTNFL